MAGGDRSKVLVLGASGMLGSAVLRYFAQRQRYAVVGSVRASRDLLPAELRDRVIQGVDAVDFDQVTRLVDATKPDVVINCVGLVKQLAEANDPLAALPINALLPHRLARLCASPARGWSTSAPTASSPARRAMYREVDPSRRARPLRPLQAARRGRLPARDHAAHLDHRPRTRRPRTGWWAGSWRSRAASRASRGHLLGLPTVELARVMRDFVVPQPELARGVYHVLGRADQQVRPAAAGRAAMATA